MRNVPFTQALSRKITSQDIETLPLKPTQIRVMSALLERYNQDSGGGLWISQRELAAQVGLSQSTVATALREASTKGFLTIFDTYIKGVGQAASRYFFPQSIIDRQVAEQIAKHPPRMSQLRGKSFEEVKPTLIVDKESGELVNQYCPTQEQRWPKSDSCEPSQENSKCQTVEDVIRILDEAENPTVADIIQALKLAQYYQEGICYIRHHEDLFERQWKRSGFLLSDFKESVRFIISDQGLLATTTSTFEPLVLRVERLKKTSDYLKSMGRQAWGDSLRYDIPPEYHSRIPLLNCSANAS
ncbi:MAG: helix-turn-helix domain-containing protein [Deltaproteobacteria bacterium]|nr:helix-turn-helix domain-containing protein [Deltaproteobacteria bacterium]